MSFYTEQCINSYLAGWMEEHEGEEPLDRDTIISCLKDEHEYLIDKLIQDDFEEMPRDHLIKILREGCEGYENMTCTQLWQEFEDRNLDF